MENKMNDKKNKRTQIKKKSVTKKRAQKRRYKRCWWAMPVITGGLIVVLAFLILVVHEIHTDQEFQNAKAVIAQGTSEDGVEVFFPGVRIEKQSVAGFTKEAICQKWETEIEKQYLDRFLGFYVKKTADGRATGIVIVAAKDHDELKQLLRAYDTGTTYLDTDELQLITAEELGYRSDYQTVIEQAFAYGRSGTLEQRAREAGQAGANGQNFSVHRTLYQAESLHMVTDRIAAMFTRDESDATLIGFDFESKQFLYTESSAGYQIDGKKLYSDTKALWEKGSGTVTVEVRELGPSENAVFDPQILRQITDDIAVEYSVEPQSSYLSGFNYATGEFQYSEATEGFYVDADALYREAVAVLENGGDTLTVNGKIVEPEGGRQVDPQTLREITDEIAAEYSKEPQDAYVSGFNFDSREFLYTDASTGTYVDADELYEEAKRELESGSNHLTVDVRVTKPGTATNQITENYGMITQAVTNASSSSKSRIANIRLACEAINGTVLMPGETFSFNGTVGQRTKAAGYQIATVYSAGEVAEDVGGGICQVSTTVWNAAMKADCELVERNAHSRPVAYVDKGKDATVSWGVQDMKFKNTSDSPMYIVAYVSDNKRVYCEIYGKLLPDGQYIKVEAKTLKTIQPGEPVYVQNRELITGTEVVVSEPRNGYKAVAYRVYYNKQDEEIRRNELCRSYYKEAAAKIEYN